MIIMTGALPLAAVEKTYNRVHLRCEIPQPRPPFGAMFDVIPAEPAVPEAQTGTGAFTPRYEDVTQDGRLRLTPMMNGIGAALWGRTLLEHPSTPLVLSDGMVPILSRIRIAALGGPISVFGPVECRGAFEMVRAITPDDRARHRIDMWIELTGRDGQGRGALHRSTGERIVVGQVLAEHTLTRPFAAPELRRVDVLPFAIPEGMSLRDTRWESPHELCELPKGCEAIDHAFALDPCPIAFGIGHTDSNRHVNSLVYPHLFEDAALRRFHALGLPTTVFARFVDIAYRKPFFAGERSRIVLRAYRQGGELGALGAFIAPEDAIFGTDPGDRAHCYVRMAFTA